MKDIVFIRGGGDIATGIAVKLFNCGFRILILEIESPLVIRRNVAFAQAIFDGETIVEGIKAIKVETINEIERAWHNNEIPIMIDETCEILNRMRCHVLVDSILAKKNLGTTKDMAKLTIGIGPGFEAGTDVDVVIETQRGHDLGRLIWRGSATKDTGIPGMIMGYDIERVIKSPCEGRINNKMNIGTMVSVGEELAKVNDVPVFTTINGVLRGIIQNGTLVKKGMKIADIDPRGIKEYCFTVSDKARTIAGGVLEAILKGGKFYGNKTV